MDNMSPKTQTISFTVPKGDTMMDRFDQIIKPHDRSSSIRKVLRYITNQDPSFLIAICASPEEIIAINQEDVQQKQE